MKERSKFDYPRIKRKKIKVHTSPKKSAQREICEYIIFGAEQYLKSYRDLKLRQHVERVEEIRKKLF